MHQTNAHFEPTGSGDGARWALETVHAPGANLAWHRHPEAYAALVLDGAYVEMSADGRFECPRGSAIIHPPNHAHSNAFSGGGARVLNILLGDSLRDIDHAIVLRPKRFERLERLLRRDASMAREAILEDSRLSEPLEPPPWLQAMAEFLAEGDEPVSVTAAARRCGVSPPHATRAFSRYFGMTPSAYRREHRLRRALALLANGAAPASAAAEAGFSDQSHLGRIVRHEVGSTPAKLRRH